MSYGLGSSLKGPLAAELMVGLFPTDSASGQACLNSPLGIFQIGSVVESSVTTSRSSVVFILLDFSLKFFFGFVKLAAHRVNGSLYRCRVAVIRLKS